MADPVEIQELVREFFPEVPDKCVTCPVIATAARNIATLVSYAANTSIGTDDNPLTEPVDVADDPRGQKRWEQEMRNGLHRWSAMNADKARRDSQYIAQLIWDDCEFGAIDPEALKHGMQTQGIDMCMSESPVTLFRDNLKARKRTK